MSFRRVSIAAALSLLGAAGAAAPAAAALGDQVVWDLSTPLDGAPAASIGSVVLEEHASFVEFTLTASWSETVFGPTAFLSSLLFVFEPVGGESFIEVDGEVPVFSLNPPIDAGYSFGVRAAFPVANAPGTDRFENGDFSVWRILGTTLASFDEAAFNAGPGKPPAFALGMLQGAFNDASYKYVAAVPEPGTWALMLAGLAGVAGIARRRLARRG